MCLCSQKYLYLPKAVSRCCQVNKFSAQGLSPEKSIMPCGRGSYLKPVCADMRSWTGWADQAIGVGSRGTGAHPTAPARRPTCCWGNTPLQLPNPSGSFTTGVMSLWADRGLNGHVIPTLCDVNIWQIKQRELVWPINFSGILERGGIRVCDYSASH